MTEQKQRRKPRKYADEFNQQLVDLYRAGKRRCDICREYDISTSLFDKWVKQAALISGESKCDKRKCSQILCISNVPRPTGEQKYLLL